MPIDYPAYQFLYPPRPERKIFAMQLGFWEKQGYYAQIKKNGTNNVLAISPRREVIAMSRHNTPHKLWNGPFAHTKTPFLGLKGGWYVFCAELLHSKVKNAKDIGLTDINYIHDVLVADSVQLTGSTFADRQALLAELFKADRLPVAASGSHLVIDQHTWLARNHKSGFRAMFDALHSPEDEGLVLKNPKGKLAPCVRPTANADWQVKIRKPNGSYDS